MIPGRYVQKIWWASEQGDATAVFERGECEVYMDYGNGAMVPWCKARNGNELHNLTHATSVWLWPEGDDEEERP